MPKVTFSNGTTVNMHYPPPFPLWGDLPKLVKYKLLPDDDPEVYLEKKDGLADAQERLMIKFAFRELDVPPDWEFPEASRSEGIEPLDGDQGRLVDYVRHGFLVKPEDVDKSNAILSYGQPVTGEEVAAARGLFWRIRRIFSFRRRKAVV